MMSPAPGFEDRPLTLMPLFGKGEGSGWKIGVVLGQTGRARHTNWEEGRGLSEESCPAGNASITLQGRGFIA